MLSTLGDPLNAEIELVSVTKEELATISARLSGAEAYQAANLQYNAALVGARVSVERRPSGQPYIKITSSRPVNEPFIDVLVEMTRHPGVWCASTPCWSIRRAPRPPPAAATPAPAAAAPAPAPAAPPVAAAAPSIEAGPPLPAPAPMAGAREYGPVKRGETLSMIAKSVMPEGVTLEQMLVGLFRSNPDAFINKNLNLVKTGRILRVPDKDDIAAIPPPKRARNSGRR